MTSFLSLGRIHIPLYGLFAAFGLMCAMLLGLRTSVLARIDPDGLWDAGMIAVLSAFVLSRALLVVENIHTFFSYPMAVLELPSLTQGGELATLVITIAYLRYKRLPLLGVLDAAAPCAALLWAFLNAGTYAEGTREGMISSLPWAIESSFGRVHPVEIYATVTWLALSGLLFWLLRYLPRRGETGAWGMILGGLALYTVDFFRLPYMLYGATLFNGVQQRAVILMVLGTLLLAWRVGIGASRVQTKGVDNAI